MQRTSDIGNLARQRRREAGYTIQQLEELLGCGTRFLSEVERGKGGASIGRVLQIAASLGLEMRMGKSQCAEIMNKPTYDLGAHTGFERFDS